MPVADNGESPRHYPIESPLNWRVVLQGGGTGDDNAFSLTFGGGRVFVTGDFVGSHIRPTTGRK